jgi:hypothetical protein
MAREIAAAGLAFSRKYLDIRAVSCWVENALRFNAEVNSKVLHHRAGAAELQAAGFDFFTAHHSSSHPKEL